ncbi:hypothetical protein [Sinorhizobium sp. GL28]|uniref:hypothetical protein n=1 Tax=Sinorhizobium sp. GL28 TaxID=1358418 RepID=UPI00071DFE69|nr:hypothetical protein [Sinorhizobium sp. GL28]KSV95392.1 hypothetical protein N184_00165 [Sinorhizobium sp. GL28]
MSTASFDFDVRYMRKGKHSVMLFLPPEYHAPIGLVIAFWGNFEVFFDKVLAGLIEGEASDGVTRDTLNWRRRNFERRRELFRDICKEWIASWQPEASQKLLHILDQSGDLSAKRNTVAHGTYAYSIAPYSSDAVDVRALNHSTGKEWPFTVDTLKKLYHDISHLTYDIYECFLSIGKIEGDFHAIADSEILRVYRETHHPWHPNPKKRIAETD